MRELLPVISDDLDWTEKQVRTPATQHEYVGWEGHWYLVDLTDEHDAELRQLIKRYVKAGTRQDGQPKPRPVAGRQSAAYQRNQRILAFAKERGLKFTERGQGEGSPYFPVATMRAYTQAHPEDQD